MHLLASLSIYIWENWSLSAWGGEAGQQATQSLQRGDSWQEAAWEIHFTVWKSAGATLKMTLNSSVAGMCFKAEEAEQVIMQEGGGCHLLWSNTDIYFHTNLWTWNDFCGIEKKSKSKLVTLYFTLKSFPFCYKSQLLAKWPICHNPVYLSPETTINTNHTDFHACFYSKLFFVFSAIRCKELWDWAVTQEQQQE